MASLEMNIQQVNADISSIKDAIVNNGVEVADGTPTSEYSEKIDKVYKKAQQDSYDEFWDKFFTVVKDESKLYNLTRMFAGVGWHKKTFTPNRKIKPLKADWMFDHMAWSNDVEPADLSQFDIDFSECATLKGTFANAHLVSTGLVDCSSATALTETFLCSDWGIIQKIHLKVVETNTFQSTFNYCGSTTEIIFTNDSVIASNGINLKWSTKLSKESFISTINALSTTTNGLTVTFSQTAKQNTFTDEEWATLIATKSNWTIALA